MNRFLHHSDYHDVITLSGKVAGASEISNLFTCPEGKLCVLFGIAGGALAACVNPALAQDVAGGALGGFMLSHVAGRAWERLTFIHGSAGFEIPGSPPGQPAYYMIEKSARGEAPEAMSEKTARGIARLATVFGRQARSANTVALLAGVATAYAMYQRGYTPAVFSVVPFLAGLQLRMLAAAERFARLRNGTYTLKRP